MSPRFAFHAVTMTVRPELLCKLGQKISTCIVEIMEVVPHAKYASERSTHHLIYNVSNKGGGLNSRVRVTVSIARFGRSYGRKWVTA